MHSIMLNKWWCICEFLIFICFIFNYHINDIKKYLIRKQIENWAWRAGPPKQIENWARPAGWAAKTNWKLSLGQASWATKNGRKIDDFFRYINDFLRFFFTVFARRPSISLSIFHLQTDISSVLPKL